MARQVKQIYSSKFADLGLLLQIEKKVNGNETSWVESSKSRYILNDFMEGADTAP